MEETINNYDPVKVDTVKLILKRAADSGNPRSYEISIDNIPIVERTNDVSEFDSYEDFLYDGTKELKITIYTKSMLSPKPFRRFIFLLTKEEEKKPEPQSLNGIGLGEIEARINEKVSEKVSIAKERWDCEQVKRDLEAVKTKLSEAENYIETLETMLEDTKSNLQRAEDMGDLKSIIKDIAVPHLIPKNQPNGNLSGSENEMPSGKAKPEEEASFSKAGESKELSEVEKRYMSNGKFIEEKFTPGEMKTVVSIMGALAADKSNINKVASLLDINNNQTKTQKNEKI